MNDEVQVNPTEAFNLPVSLLDAFARRRVTHAILLVGSPHTTEKAARWFARMLLCQRDSGAPCGECPACRQFDSGVHPDFLEVGEGTIRTGDIEVLQRWLSVKSHGERKVYTLKNVESMTPVAANRVLKTLEEPEPGVYAILTATERQRVLSTIRSRTLMYELPASEAYLSTDHFAVPLLESVFGERENDTFDGFVDQMLRWTEMWLVEKQPALILAATWQSYCETVSAMDSLMLLAEWFRDMLYARAGASNRRFRDLEPQIVRIAPMLEVGQWTRSVEIVLESRGRLNSHVASLLNFEQMCIRLREVVT